jgi:molybdate transport system ATP-binding protein
MDEPLAALDTARKAEILPLIERIAADFAVPILYVSHSVEEVVRLAETVAVVDAGRIVAVGGPTEVLVAAASDGDRFDLVSVVNAVAGPFDPDFRLTELRHPAGALHLAGRVGPPGRPLRLVVRATDVTLALPPPPVTTAQTALLGVVASITTGDAPTAGVTVALAGGDRLVASITRQSAARLGLSPGQPVAALIKTVALDERPYAAEPRPTVTGEPDEPG